MQDIENISSLETLEFFAKNLVEGFITGKHKSPYHGFSVEFAEHRLYNKGESTKYVDWKLFGRTDKLFVKKYEEETNLRCQIIIDTSSSMFYPQVKNPSLSNPNKILYSVYSSAALMNLFKKQRDSVGLSLYSDDLYFHSPNKGSNKHHIFLKKRMLDVLCSTTQFKTTSSVDSIHKIASKLQKRSLVLFFTDMLDGSEDLSEIFLALQHLKFQKHEVVLFYLSEEKTEFQLRFPNTPHNFIDIETKEEIKLNPIEIRESFKNKSKSFLKDLKIRCLQHKIDLVEVDINKGVEQILISYLLKRQKMF
ncbi:MAG: DUF58 domain-containing protein [Flavobacteriales bacterium]|nr:DUF58 domain-containing protein [Flavobacteriales bacterium]